MSTRSSDLALRQPLFTLSNATSPIQLGSQAAIHSYIHGKRPALGQSIRCCPCSLFVAAVAAVAVVVLCTLTISLLISCHS